MRRGAHARHSGSSSVASSTPRATVKTGKAIRKSAFGRFFNSCSPLTRTSLPVVGSAHRCVPADVRARGIRRHGRCPGWVNPASARSARPLSITIRALLFGLVRALRRLYDNRITVSVERASMKIIVWLIRVLVFVVLLVLALANQQGASLRFAGYEWQAPLILIGLAFFAVGGQARRPESVSL